MTSMYVVIMLMVVRNASDLDSFFVRSSDIRQPEEDDRLHRDSLGSGDDSVHAVHRTKHSAWPRNDHHPVHRPWNGHHPSGNPGL